MRFYNIKIKGVDRLSLPVGLISLSNVLHNLYVPHKLLARVSWMIIRVGAKFGAIKFFASEKDTPSVRLENFNWQGWISEITDVLKQNRLIPAFYFPPQLERKKYSVLLLNNEGESIAFAKIAQDPVSYAETLRERNALLYFNDKKFATFEVPKLLQHGNYKGSLYNLLSPIPRNTRTPPSTWGDLYQQAWLELVTTSYRNIKIENLSWWPKVKFLFDEWVEAIELLEKDEPLNGYRFYFAHGDFAPWNVSIVNKNLFLYDWENFSEEAPIFADPLYFILSTQILLKNDTFIMSIIRKIRMIRNLRFIDIAFSDVTLALLYFRISLANTTLISVLDKVIREIIRS